MGIGMCESMNKKISMKVYLSDSMSINICASNSRIMNMGMSETMNESMNV